MSSSFTIITINQRITTIIVFEFTTIYTLLYIYIVLIYHTYINNSRILSIELTTGQFILSWPGILQAKQTEICPVLLLLRFLSRLSIYIYITKHRLNNISLLICNHFLSSLPQDLPDPELNLVIYY